MGLGQTKPKTTNVATVSPEQQALIDQFTQLSGGALPQAFQAILNQLDPQQSAQFFQENIAAPQREQFFKTTVPGIQQQFANLGSKGGTSLDRQLAQSASGLETNLARQLAQFQQQGQQQGISNLGQFAGIGLKPGFQPVFQPSGPGFGEQATAGLIQALPFILAAL